MDDNLNDAERAEAALQTLALTDAAVIKMAPIKAMTDAMVEEALRQGAQNGKLEILRWLAGHVDTDLAVADPYQDTRALQTMKVLLADKIREVTGDD